MKPEYYGWLGTGGYDTVIKIENYDAYVFRVTAQKFIKNNYYLKAKWDPGTDFEAITEEEAEKVLNRLTGGTK